MEVNKKFLILIIFGFEFAQSQHISEFNTLVPSIQDTDFHIPLTHSFQYIIEEQDPLSEGGTLPVRCDFTGYVPIDTSSSNAYLSINSEASPGGVTILDIRLDKEIGKWIVNRSEAVDFSVVNGTSRN